MQSVPTIRQPDAASLDELCNKLAVLAPELDADDAWPEEQLQLCGEYGVFEWFVAPEFGGQGWSDVDVVRGYLRLSSACLTTTFVITQRTGACRRIAMAENAWAREQCLPSLIQGRRFATVGISHLTTSRQHLERPVLAATVSEDSVILDGYSPWVSGAKHADWIVTGAVTDDGRQVLVAVPAVAAAWWWARVGTARVVALLAACAVGVAVLAGPWAVRNARQLGEPVFISTNSGDNLCLGYNPDANGGFGMYPACDTGEFYVDGPAAELRRNKENRRNALDYIADEPGSIPLLAAKKLWITFESDDDGLRANESYGEDVFMSAGWRTAWQIVAHIAYVVIMVATAWGTLLAARRLRGGARGDLPMLLTLLVLGAAGLAVPMAVFGDPRFKVPSTPVLAVLAGLATAQLATAVAARTSIASDDGGAVEVSG